MCDFGQHTHHPSPGPGTGRAFGFLVDVPDIRALIDKTRRLAREIPDPAERVEALRPAFGKVLAANGVVSAFRSGYSNAKCEPQPRA